MSRIIIRSRLGLLIQLAGVISSYASILLIARFDGPAAQGFFVSIKSFVDTVYALFMAGLPQALILVINRKQLNLRSTVPYVEAYIVVIFLLSIPITWKFMALDSGMEEALIFLPIGITGMSMFGLTRSLLLTRTDGFFFSAFTAAPQSLLLLFVAIHLFVVESSYLYVYLYFGTVLFFISQVILVYLYRLERAQPFMRIPFRGLFSENVHSFAQAVLYNGQLFLVLRVLSAHQVPRGDIGKVSTAVLPLLALHALIGIVAPILYNQWSKQERPTELSTMVVYLGRLALIGQAVALLALPVVGPVTVLIFGPAYADSVPAVQVALFGVLPVIYTRLISPYLQTSGRAVLNSATCLVRWGSAVALLLVAVRYGFSSMILPVAALWAIAEWLALIFQLIAPVSAWFAPRAHRA